MPNLDLLHQLDAAPQAIVASGQDTATRSACVCYRMRMPELLHRLPLQPTHARVPHNKNSSSSEQQQQQQQQQQRRRPQVTVSRPSSRSPYKRLDETGNLQDFSLSTDQGFVYSNF
jgi:hypothetical protein